MLSVFLKRSPNFTALIMKRGLQHLNINVRYFVTEVGGLCNLYIKIHFIWYKWPMN